MAANAGDSAFESVYVREAMGIFGSCAKAAQWSHCHAGVPGRQRVGGRRRARKRSTTPAPSKAGAATTQSGHVAPRNTAPTTPTAPTVAPMPSSSPLRLRRFSSRGSAAPAGGSGWIWAFVFTAMRANGVHKGCACGCPAFCSNESRQPAINRYRSCRVKASTPESVPSKLDATTRATRGVFFGKLGSSSTITGTSSPASSTIGLPSSFSKKKR